MRPIHAVCRYRVCVHPCPCRSDRIWFETSLCPFFLLVLIFSINWRPKHSLPLPTTQPIIFSLGLPYTCPDRICCRESRVFIPSSWCQLLLCVHTHTQACANPGTEIKCWEETGINHVSTLVLITRIVPIDAAQGENLWCRPKGPGHWLRSANVS